MGTAQYRGHYDHGQLRYPSDPADDWAYVEPLIPLAMPGRNKRTSTRAKLTSRTICVLSIGVQWQAILKDLPPRSTLIDSLDP